MRKWTLPLAIVGLGGLGAMLLSGRGRKLFRFASEGLAGSSGRVAAWTESAQTELERIQKAVKKLEQSLPGTHTAS